LVTISGLYWREQAGEGLVVESLVAKFEKVGTSKPEARWLPVTACARSPPL
jgi:hypothetical protein